VIRLLEKDGWHHVRTKGSHRQFQHSVKPGTVTVSGKLGIDMPFGTLNSILKQSGLKRCGSIEMEYLVVLEKGKTSYGAYVPDLPGCVAVGETRRDVLKLIREGIELHIEALRDAGETIPPPTSKSEIVKIRAA
jgi:predicted RNA binding protein YcfA (HicA-like mRNA interferase family)/predicted RNase H-like HicB family nuclease